MIKDKMTIKDIVTAAIMMALFYGLSFVIGMSTVTFPILYLYGTAGLEMFLGAVFYLVAAHRINKHGLLFLWVMIYAGITAAMGYRNPVRNIIGWSTYGIGMFLGIGVPCWIAWESYKQQALESGFADATVKLQYDMVSSPFLILIGTIITVALSVAGILSAQRILKKHFQKAGILD